MCLRYPNHRLNRILVHRHYKFCGQKHKETHYKFLCPKARHNLTIFVPKAKAWRHITQHSHANCPSNTNFLMLVTTVGGGFASALFCFFFAGVFFFLGYLSFSFESSVSSRWRGQHHLLCTSSYKLQMQQLQYLDMK